MLQCTGELIEELEKVDHAKWGEWETVEPIVKEIVRKYRVLYPGKVDGVHKKASPEYERSPQKLENGNLRHGNHAGWSGK